MNPRAAVIVGYGINCDYELAEAFKRAGASVDRIHLNDLLKGKVDLRQYHIIGFAGGFSFGDDAGAGNIFAKKIIYNEKTREGLVQHLDDGKLIFGTCNGNQIATFMNLIPVDGKYFSEPEVAYSFNNSARYEDRGNIHMKVISGMSHWLTGLEGSVLSNFAVGHGEGKFTPKDGETWGKVKAFDLVALKYVHADGTAANGEYPINPNSSLDDIAGLASKQVLLLMPHPERAMTAYNQDGWTRRKSVLKRQGLSLPDKGEGMLVFDNGVNYCRENLL